MSEARDLRSYQREAGASLEALRLSGEGWPPESIECYRKTGHTEALLYPFMGVENGVRTPQGIGTLLQVFAGEARVLLMRTRATKTDLSGKQYRPMTEFDPEAVKPYTRGES